MEEGLEDHMCWGFVERRLKTFTSSGVWTGRFFRIFLAIGGLEEVKALGDKRLPSKSLLPNFDVTLAAVERRVATFDIATFMC